MFTPRTIFSGACFSGARVLACSLFCFGFLDLLSFDLGRNWQISIGMSSGVFSERESTYIATDSSSFMTTSFIHRFFRRNCGFFSVLKTLKGRFHCGLVVADVQRDYWGTIWARAFHSGCKSSDS